MSMLKPIDIILEIYTFPVLIIFLIAFLGISNRYLKYKRVTDQFVPSREVKKRIDSGEKLLVYIIDPFTCSSCIETYPLVKKILEERGLSFVLVNSREVNKHMNWGRVPAVIAYEDGVSIRTLDSSQQIRKLRIDQYQHFAQEVMKQWKIA